LKLPDAANEYGMHFRYLDNEAMLEVDPFVKGDKASILEEHSNEALTRYLQRCSKFASFDVARAYDVTLAHIREHDGKEIPPGAMAEIDELEKRWFASLGSDPDYSVYSSPFYFCELWLCWLRYSRRYLSLIQSPTMMKNSSIMADIGPLRSILDLGCGFGYTTGALKQLYPDAEVIGTNLETTTQFAMASELGKEYGFKICGDHIGRQADLIFASEYFEHIREPIEHLESVLTECKPKRLLIANAFGTDAIGHFKEYRHNGISYAADKISRMFNAALRSREYQKMETRCWNGRPAYWRKEKPPAISGERLRGD
jgi:SAM-dependent methyltransferase